MEDSRAKIQPLVEQVQSEAAKLQEQVKPLISNIEEQIRPLTDDFNAQVLTDNLQNQVKPLTNMMEKFLQQVMEQSKALLPPQWTLRLDEHPEWTGAQNPLWTLKTFLFQFHWEA